MKKILVCYGTRPEYIKLKSIIDNINVKTCYIKQHEDLVDYHNPNISINIVSKTENRLNNIIANILVHNIFQEIDYVIVQGDTTTALAVSLSAFNYGIKIIHLEAGLRSGNIRDPYPEEINRQLISKLANIHLCPTINNKKNLENEGIFNNVYVVGNTILDNISKDDCSYTNNVLITLHRTETQKNIKAWFNHLNLIAIKYPMLEFILPIHPNPKILKYNSILKKVKVIKPLSHNSLINILKKCRFVISDSGGIQEECSYLNKKIIVCRKNTERIEILNKNSYLCNSPEKLSDLVDKINNDYKINIKSPYGDGNSWVNIKNILLSL